MFALVDANSFYCSAEQVFRPDWRGKPIVVLSNNDGCVVAANRQATALGIPKFKPYFQVQALCQRHGVIVLSSNYELYADLSARMMSVIGRFAPEQHIYSIDESFLAFRHCAAVVSDWKQYGHVIRQAVWKECRLPVGVGMGQTLTLAKAANHAAKHMAGYDGVCVLECEEERVRVLSQMAASEVWGIGRRVARRLAGMGIRSALELAQQPPGVIKAHFNVVIERTVRELNGQSCISWETARADKQQIFSTRSVGERITDSTGLAQALSKHAGIASRKARSQGSLCRVMVCFAASSPYDRYPVSKRVVHRFSYPTADVHHLTSTVSQMVPALFQQQVQYYKIGVGLLDLISDQHEQFDLMNPAPNNLSLMKVYDDINTRYGNDTLFLAAQGIEQKWQMRRAFLTPQYSTCWRDVPVIRA
ncbi:DNA polymerase IV [Vibrio aerogenes CECT 7868]|uniref:DNA polymerase IV n=1 Tax=Vibrio aerogenes CECT 7868 TaxID=1216006 RepID=A0A1M5UUF1_9VIBR|nr:Y-family DNA polymerase [Vibrio aerogenes]SHH66585.1 DNA polymerase IV [Vibrio aerogenes CECT 7868]